MQDNLKSKYTQLIKAKAISLGFESVGIAKARFLETGSVTMDGVTEAHVWVGWLKDEVHIQSNMSELMADMFKKANIDVMGMEQ